jgi:hypothetical protein
MSAYSPSFHADILPLFREGVKDLTDDLSAIIM